MVPEPHSVSQQSGWPRILVGCYRPPAIASGC
jgi:hypothetical protein